MRVFHTVPDYDLYLTSTIVIKENKEKFENFAVVLVSDMEYVPFCEDFGPFNLSEIHRFISAINCLRCEDRSRKIVCVAEGIHSDLTNGAFLLGCYITMVLDVAPEAVWESFRTISNCLIPYRDATMNWSDFELPLIDCWRALKHASSEGWMVEYDMSEYAHYDNPLEGNLHALIPSRLIALQGPKSLAGGAMYLDRLGQRTFSPLFYLEPFQDMGVGTVVRLNEREYADAEFEEHGVRCVSLEFEGALPPPDAVIAFLHTMRAAKGAVAVHCRSGLGRTGTLCALHLMLSHGFSACEAMAWVRIVHRGGAGDT